MKIAISGAHSQGKTTLVNFLQECKSLSDFKFKTSLTRGLQEAGFNINEDGDDVTQLAVMTKHLQRLQEDGSVVYDRCALDGYAYSLALVKDLKILDIIKDLFLIMVDKYDIIFYVEPELPLIADGQRSIDVQFYKKIVQNFDNIIKSYAIPVVRISGSVEQRANMVIDAVNNLEATMEDYFYYEL
jgi:nicotinamide riboside kinase